MDGKLANGVFLAGPRVFLRPVEDGDAELLYKWGNDPELRVLTGAVTPEPMPAIKERIGRLQSSPDRWWMIGLRESGRMIGECGLLRIFWPWRTADVTMILGERDAQGQGYATEAAELVLEYAFASLGLHRLAIGVVGFNERALHWWQKLGFRQEGVQRDGYYGDGRFSDFVMMSLLAPEYRATQRKPR